MDNFIDSMDKNQEGVGGIEEYINEDEIDLHVHKNSGNGTRYLYQSRYSWYLYRSCMGPEEL